MRRLVLALLLAGCGDWKSDGAARLEELYPTPPAPSTEDCPLPDDPGAAPVEVGGACTRLASGRWAARMVQFGTINPAGMGPWNLTLTDYFLVALAPGGASLELTFCGQTPSLTDLNGRPVALGTTRVPAATASAIGKRPLVLPLPGDGTLRASDIAWLWGVKDLANPLADPLPTDAADAHVWDQDEDGNPGVTVDVQNPNGQRYMARRGRWTFQTSRISFDSKWITGTLVFAVDERALGATSEVLKTVAPVGVRDDCASLYQLRCVDASVTCDALLAGAKTIFRDAPR